VRLTLQGDEPRFEGGLHEVAPGCFAWLQPNGAWGEANAGLVVGEGASILIDTLWDQVLAREMLQAMEPHTEKAPIELVVNTHSDGDHWWGNADAPQTAEILTSQASLDAMREEAPPKALARMKQLTGVTRHVPGVVPGGIGPMGRYVSEMLAPFAFDEVTTRLPDRAFSGRAVEQVGGREIELIEVGPAHTPGDLMVFVRDARTVFAADILFFDATPVMWFGPLENWLAALDLLLGLEADTFVPGHGPVGGREQIEGLRDYWHWLGEGVTKAHERGLSAREAARELADDTGFERFSGWECPERMLISVTTVHRALSGEGRIPSTPQGRASVFAEVAKLERRLRARAPA
jgi:glyoxylase-like metal-dependent hydrolase (beta-lactamase superfamily II)